jgi:solute carrier family 30 (zinc transporter), member 9
MTTHIQGKKSVTAALLGNVFVTITKATVFFITGSVSMFAEAIHSLADTLNQSLLLIGLKRSKKPADSARGYGYGIERFFWSLISACGILFIGSGVAMYHSIDSLFHADSQVHEFNPISITVLVLALIIEGITLYFAVKELRRGRKLSREIFKDADPILLAIIYEDSVAVVGVAIAIAAQWLTFITGNIIYDALGGIMVGLVLGFLAVILIIKNHQYIIGKALSKEVREEIVEALEADPCIEKIIEFKSVAIDIGKYRIFATVEWNGSPLYEEIYEAGDLQLEYDEVKDDFKKFAKLMFRTTDRIPRLVGTHIDMIEKNITEKFPEIAYVDIEIN